MAAGRATNKKEIASSLRWLVGSLSVAGSLFFWYVVARPAPAVVTAEGQTAPPPDSASSAAAQPLPTLLPTLPAMPGAPVQAGRPAQADPTPLPSVSLPAGNAQTRTRISRPAPVARSRSSR